MSDPIDNLRSIRKRMRASARDALKNGANEIKNRSDSQVPVDTGELLASGYVRQEKQGVFVVGYSAPHALIVHEDSTLNLNSGSSKFLQSAFIELSRNILADIAEAVKR